MRIIIAWIKKYIFHIHSPSCHPNGYDFEYDYLKARKEKRIKDLKLMIEFQDQTITELYVKINELEAELEESRAKEGKGVLETTMESITNLVNNICGAINDMPPDELERLIIQNNDDEDGDSDAI